MYAGDKDLKHFRKRNEDMESAIQQTCPENEAFLSMIRHFSMTETLCIRCLLLVFLEFLSHTERGSSKCGAVSVRVLEWRVGAVPLVPSAAAWLCPQ